MAWIRLLALGPLPATGAAKKKKKSKESEIALGMLQSDMITIYSSCDTIDSQIYMVNW